MSDYASCEICFPLLGRLIRIHDNFCISFVVENGSEISSEMRSAMSGRQLGTSGKYKPPFPPPLGRALS